MPDSAKPPPFTVQELVRRLRQKDCIPALDENVAQLCRMTGNKDTAATELTLVIMRDAAITSRLLAMANSATYRTRTPVKTVSAAAAKRLEKARAEERKRVKPTRQRWTRPPS